MAKVFVSGPLPGEGIGRLRAAHDVIESDGGIRSAAYEACRADVEAVLTLVTDRVDAAFLAGAPRLRVVANVAVGVDNIDLAACKARGIRVTNTPGVLTEATADLAFGLLLAAARRIAEGDRVVRSGGFTRWSPTFMLGKRVNGAALGIVGMGRIGQAVARRARGFGMRVLYTQRSRVAAEVEQELAAEHVTLDELLARADFISLHCPLTSETKHLFDAQRLARMRAGSILVNTSRGAVVDEAALAGALEHGPLAAAGLDVYEREPIVHPALLALSNVVLAPHIGSAEGPTREAMADAAVANALAVLAGGAPISPVV